jgi:hypothetical protein
MKNICNVTFFSGAKAQAAVSGGKIATEQKWLGAKSDRHCKSAQRPDEVRLDFKD